MEKQIIFMMAFIIGSLNLAKAQDTIVFKNQESKIVKITQIKSEELTCKDFANLEGPDYIYELSKITAIHFKNGIVQDYNIPDNDVEYVNDVPVKKYEEPTTLQSDTASVLPKKLYKYEERSEYYKNVPYQHEYGDLYNPALAGVASYFIPGLGQMISGETGRGLAFFGGTVGAYLVTMIGFTALASETYYYENYYYHNNNNNKTLYTAMAVGGLISTIGLEIWSIVDAVHVAKVNNLYNRDLRRQRLASIRLSPYIDASKQTLSLNNQPAVGLSLKVNF